jgi:hypothetical protein
LPNATKKKPKEKYEESMDRQSNRSVVCSIYWVGDHLRLQALSFKQIPLFTPGVASPIHCSFPSKKYFALCLSHVPAYIKMSLQEYMNLLFLLNYPNVWDTNEQRDRQ